jgi:hypothetical protein
MSMLEKKWKPKMSKKRVTLDTIKYMFEKDAQKVIKTGGTPIGFQMSDLLALIPREQLAGIGPDGTNWSELITRLVNQPYRTLSRKQTELLSRISLSLWDIVMAGSGGHPGITNISGLNFWGKGYVDEVMKPMHRDIAEVLCKLSKAAGVK